jgi:hypothetical protein
MKQYLAELANPMDSPLSFSKHYSPIDVPFLETESHGDYDRRTWRERSHYTGEQSVENLHGEVFIPPMMIKNAISNAAKYLSVRIPGKGQSTYTKHFEAGLMVTDSIMLGIKKSELKSETLYLPADGQRGGTKRVDRTFPRIESWKGTVTLLVYDETVTGDVLREHLIEAGKFIGLGRFRPRNNGYYGRFFVTDFGCVS